MAKGKVTMKDIAKELNISLATVSYVINHSEKEKISHDMRLKVLETAKRMGYVPNLSARSLVNRKSNLVGIMIHLKPDDPMTKKQYYYDLAAHLQGELHQIGYDTVISMTHDLENIDIISKRSLEAAFIIDVDEKHFKKITSQYYVPIIFMDCDVELQLFYKVLPDYTFLLNQAKRMLGEPYPYLIMEDVINGKVRNTLMSDFKQEDIFIHKRHADMKAFLERHIGKKGIVIGENLGVQVERYIDSSQIVVIASGAARETLLPYTRYIEVSNKRKAEMGVHILKQLLTLKYDEAAETRILMLPD